MSALIQSARLGPDRAEEKRRGRPEGSKLRVERAEAYARRGCGVGAWKAQTSGWDEREERKMAEGGGGVVIWERGRAGMPLAEARRVPSAAQEYERWVIHEGEGTNDMQPPAEFDRSPAETSGSPAEFSEGWRRGLVRRETGGEGGGEEGGREEGGGEEEDGSPAGKRWIQSATSVREEEWVAPVEAV